MTPDTASNPTPDSPGMPAALPAPPVVRMGVVLTATVAVGFTIAAGVLLLVNKPQWVGMAAMASAATLVGSLLSLELLRRGATRNHEALLLSALAGMGVRLLVAGVAAVGMVAGLGLARKPVLLALLGAYLVLLIAEARLLSGYFKTLPGPGSTAARTPASPQAEPTAC